MMLPVLIAAALVAQTPADAGEAFVRALAENRPGAVRALAATSDSDLSLPIDWVEKLDCITIPHHEVATTSASHSTASVQVSIDARGFTNGAVRLERTLPARWQLELARTDDGWRVAKAATEEKILADALIAAPASERDCLLAAHPDVDLVLLTQQVAYNFPSPENAADERGVMAFDAALAASLGNPSADLYVLRMKAMLAAFGGNMDRALSVANETVARAREVGDPTEIGLAEFGLGIVSWFAGKTDDAVRHLEAGGSLTGSVVDPRQMIRSVYMAGLISGRAGRLRQSLDAADRVDALSTAWGWEEGNIIAANQRGSIHLQLGDLEAAKAYLWKMYELARRANHDTMAAYALHNAAVPSQEGVTDQDIVLLRRAAALTPEGPARGAVNITLAEMLARLGRFAEAEDILRTADSTASEDQYRIALAELRLRQGRFQDALETVRQPDRPHTMPGMSSGDDRERAANLQRLAGKALRGLGRNAEAAVAFGNAISLIEEQRAELSGGGDSGSMFLADKVESYHELMDLELAQGHTEAALFLGEKLRARTLRHLIEEGVVDLSASMTDEEKNEEAKLTDAVAKLNRDALAAEEKGDAQEIRARLTEARSALSSFEAELYLRHPDLRPRRADAMTTAEHLGDLLPGDDTAVLVYSVHADHTHAFVIRRAGGKVSIGVQTMSGGRAARARRVSRFIDALQRRDLGFTADARALYDALIAPVARGLDGARVVCVIPDGALWHLPFQVLRAPSGDYLLERTALFFAPSLCVLRSDAPAQTATAAPRLLAFGNAAIHGGKPSLYRGSIGALPDAEREVRAIAALYARTSRVLLRDDARESAAKQLAADYDVLHFATHAVVDDAAPLYSALVMTGSNTEDGFLEAREILDLPLHADLAVLSACETARGSVRAGEGMIGMSWALMAAGCPNTLVSQWKVASASTAELMIEFHKEWTRQRRAPGAKAEALRLAQLKLMRGTYRHPFYWSPFVLIGTRW